MDYKIIKYTSSSTTPGMTGIQTDTGLNKEKEIYMEGDSLLTEQQRAIGNPLSNLMALLQTPICLEHKKKDIMVFEEQDSGNPQSVPNNAHVQMDPRHSPLLRTVSEHGDKLALSSEDKQKSGKLQSKLCNLEIPSPHKEKFIYNDLGAKSHLYSQPTPEHGSVVLMQWVEELMKAMLATLDIQEEALQSRVRGMFKNLTALLTFSSIRNVTVQCQHIGDSIEVDNLSELTGYMLLSSHLKYLQNSDIRGLFNQLNVSTSSFIKFVNMAETFVTLFSGHLHKHSVYYSRYQHTSTAYRTTAMFNTTSADPPTSAAPVSLRYAPTIQTGDREAKNEEVFESPDSINLTSKQDPKASPEESNTSVDIPLRFSSTIQTDFFTPHSWDTKIQQHSSDYASLYEFIRSLPSEVLTQRDAQNRTICHALCSLGHHLPFSKVQHLQLLSHVCLPQCMTRQDSSGNTPLHCAIEAQITTTGVVESILGFVPPESLVIRNADNCTPLDLAFEKKLWVSAWMLAEHQLKTGAVCSPDFLRGYFFKAMREQGGVDFLPLLLDLWKRYHPDHDLNFSVDQTNRTPWWYLVNSNDVTVMYRALQALKNYSIDIGGLLTHTGTTTTLVEEAENKNKDLFLLIRNVTGWHHSEADLDTTGEDVASSHSSLTVSSSLDQSESNTSTSVLSQHSSVNQTESDSFTPHSWDGEIQQHSSGLASLIQSIPSEVLTQKDAQGRTICHALCSSCHHLPFCKVQHLPQLLSYVCLPQCMTSQDSSGNTPLHCAIEAQNTTTGVVESILDFVPPECLVIRNVDNCTPLDLAFEKKLWASAWVLAEHQLKTVATNSPEFLRGYFFKAMREQGGVDFLPHLLDLWKRYHPDHDLNFSVDQTNRTPWWYLVNSNDVSVMCRALQALKSHSIDFTSLLTHTGTETRLVEEAVDKNRGLFTLIRKVAGWYHSEVDQNEADQDTTDQDISSTLGSSGTLSSCSSVTYPSSFDQSESHAIHPELDMSYNLNPHMSQTDSSDEN